MRLERGPLGWLTVMRMKNTYGSSAPLSLHRSGQHTPLKNESSGRRGVETRVGMWGVVFEGRLVQEWGQGPDPAGRSYVTRDSESAHRLINNIWAGMAN